MGDTAQGTTLVGVDTSTGAKLCSQPIPQLRELGFVGIGQSLSFDHTSKTLILSGLVANTTQGHGVLTADASAYPPTCNGFTSAGFFGDAMYAPMIHAAAFDEAGQRLFVLLALGKQGPDAVGTYDLRAKKLTSVAIEGATPDAELFGMKWDAKSKTVIGVWPGGTQVDLNHLDPATGKWSSASIENGMELPMIGGNDGTVAAWDAAAGHLFVFMGTRPSNPNADFVRHLARIDVHGGSNGGPALGTHPVLGAIGPMANCSDCLAQMCM